MFIDRTDELAMLEQLLTRQRGGELLLLYGPPRWEDRATQALGQPERTALDLLDGAEGAVRTPASQAVCRDPWAHRLPNRAHLCELI